MTVSQHRPARTCVGCRRRSDDGSLLRFVAENGSVRLASASAGRGAWLCRESERCAELAISKGALRRSLRKEICVTASDLMNLMRSSVVMKGCIQLG